MQQTGAITSYIDVAQLTLYAFWIFFLGLVLYLRREDRREGYPLEADAARKPRNRGFEMIAPDRTFLLADGNKLVVPAGGHPDHRPLDVSRIAVWPGAPVQPNGDPMLAGVGPGSWAERQDEPERLMNGMPLIVPLRADEGTSVDPNDPDPRGMEVIACDREVAGRVSDVWYDRGEPQIRYLEVELADGGKRVLLPIYFAKIDDWRRTVKVRSITARQFANVPTTKSDDEVTKLEEEKIMAYYAAGKLYATPQRLGPVL